MHCESKLVNVVQSLDSMVTKEGKLLTDSKLCSMQSSSSEITLMCLAFHSQPLFEEELTAPKYLLTYQNHTIVHPKYREACCEEHNKFMEYRSFLNTWHQCLPHMVFMTPRCDICKLCEDHRVAIQDAVTEGEEQQKLAEF